MSNLLSRSQPCRVAKSALPPLSDVELWPLASRGLSLGRDLLKPLNVAAEKLLQTEGKLQSSVFFSLQGVFAGLLTSALPPPPAPLSSGPGQLSPPPPAGVGASCSPLRPQGSAHFQDFGWKGKDTKGSFKLTAAYTFHFFSFVMTKKKKKIQIFKFLLLLILLLFDNLVSNGLFRSCIPGPFTFSLNVVPNLQSPPPVLKESFARSSYCCYKPGEGGFFVLFCFF